VVSEERSAQRQRWSAVVLVIVGLLVVAAVTLWDHWRLPSNPLETSPAREAASGPSSSFEALFAALGIHRPTEPSEAPDFSLMSLDGQSVRLRDLRGKLVLLNFWATWCAPCLHEMPSMERLYQTFKPTEFVLLAVSMDRQGAEVARPFADNLKLTFPILLDAASEVAREYSVRGLPTTYLIAPDGLLIGAVIGARDWYRTEAKALIAGLLRQRPSGAGHPAQVSQ
jgi:peroxiredoxin